MTKLSEICPSMKELFRIFFVTLVESRTILTRHSFFLSRFLSFAICSYKHIYIRKHRQRDRHTHIYIFIPPLALSFHWTPCTYISYSASKMWWTIESSRIFLWIFSGVDTSQTQIFVRKLFQFSCYWSSIDLYNIFSNVLDFSVSWCSVIFIAATHCSLARMS